MTESEIQWIDGYSRIQQLVDERTTVPRIYNIHCACGLSFTYDPDKDVVYCPNCNESYEAMRRG